MEWAWEVHLRVDEGERMEDASDDDFVFVPDEGGGQECGDTVMERCHVQLEHIGSGATQFIVVEQ